MSERELEIFYSQLSNKIIELRMKMNLTQQAFADKLNISRVSIVNIERKRQRPTIHFLYNISILAKVDMNYFFNSYNREVSINEKILDKISKINLNDDEKSILKNYISNIK